MSAINGGTPRGVGIGVADYVVFGVSLVIPVIISLYYCCIKKQKSNAEFLMGNRSINAIPMSFSLCASYMSAIVITGITNIVQVLTSRIHLNQHKLNDFFHLGYLLLLLGALGSGAFLDLIHTCK